MNNRVVFRLAVIGLFIFEIAICVALYFFDDGALDSAWQLLPETVDWYIYFESYPAIVAVAMFGLLSLIVVSFIGVLLFRNWARWLYLGSAVLVSLVSLFTGPIISYAWEHVLWEIASMTNGAIMLAMFLPPISNQFNKLSNSSND
ncbi:hypothetical protein HQQ94_12985 [Shewanella sp. VB17]|uniref:hypothetical protein n=1 Tax=Shewanella sp. VB17 TaxID=2739432 RepID=UPI0015676980|nr:hypothetical protein [Shewanella sp. VB17]NRD74134.1 hypothetical protein [Shewanella sp. VB17]